MILSSCLFFHTIWTSSSRRLVLQRKTQVLAWSVHSFPSLFPNLESHPWQWRRLSTPHPKWCSKFQQAYLKVNSEIPVNDESFTEIAVRLEYIQEALHLFRPFAWRRVDCTFKENIGGRAPFLREHHWEQTAELRGIGVSWALCYFLTDSGEFFEVVGLSSEGKEVHVFGLYVIELSDVRQQKIGAIAPVKIREETAWWASRARLGGTRGSS